ncbi:RsiV family protein [Mycobacteroides chelonae]|uniref:RsiV family protein n=1 Tax=Mycobacteroides chelonae TaxID=1774 RepID=UPI001F3AF254|nr:RsiV family protein [Mycobacteroides chelonae]
MNTMMKASTPFAVVVATLFTATLGVLVAAVADTGTSGGATYTVSTTTIDLGADWHVTVGQLTGGNSAVATAFNNASIASGRTMGTMLDSDGVLRGQATFDATPTVSFRPTTVSQVLRGVYYHQGAAHPLNAVTTVVIDTRNATPITLDDLFTDTQAGLPRLSEQTKQIWPTVYGRPMGDEPGNTPVEKNFHNWIPTAGGLEIYFEDYQFGHGQPVITIPWPQLTGLLAPDMQVLAQ